MANGYTLAFLFSGAEHSLFEQIKLIALGLVASELIYHADVLQIVIAL
jgi:hypothetical protein